jgi:hypothetical protein
VAACRQEEKSILKNVLEQGSTSPPHIHPARGLVLVGCLAAAAMHGKTCPGAAGGRSMLHVGVNLDGGQRVGRRRSNSAVG